MANIPPLPAREIAKRVAPTSQALVNSRRQQQGGQGQKDGRDGQDGQHEDRLEDTAAGPQQAGAHKTIGALQRAPASGLQHVSDAPIEDDDVAHLARWMVDAEPDGPSTVADQPAEQDGTLKRT